MATENLDLDLPVVGQTTGPQWAEDLNTAIETIDEQVFSPNNPVPASGINLDNDLSFNQHKATNVHAMRFMEHVAVLVELNALYDVEGDLYWNNGNGVPIQITDDGALNLGAVETNVYAVDSKTTNYTILAADTFTLLLVSTSVSAKTITLPLANSVSQGRFYIIKDSSNNAGTNNITISPQGSNTIDNSATSKTITVHSGSMVVASNGSNGWLTLGYVSGATTSSAGILKLSQDLSGTANAPKVVKVNNATVPAAGSHVAGNVLVATGPYAFEYSPIQLDGGANYVEGVLPVANLPDASTSEKGIVKLSGDLNGDNTSATSPRVGQLAGVDGFVECNGTLNINQGMVVNTVAVTTDYTIDSSETNLLLLVDTSAARNITLPSLDYEGRIITIKDSTGQCSTNNITLLRASGSISIESVTANRTLASDYGSWTLVTNSVGNYHFI